MPVLVMITNLNSQSEESFNFLIQALEQKWHVYVNKIITCVKLNLGFIHTLCMMLIRQLYILNVRDLEKALRPTEYSQRV